MADKRRKKDKDKIMAIPKIGEEIIEDDVKQTRLPSVGEEIGDFELTVRAKQKPNPSQDIVAQLRSGDITKPQALEKLRALRSTNTVAPEPYTAKEGALDYAAALSQSPAGSIARMTKFPEIIRGFSEEVEGKPIRERIVPAIKTTAAGALETAKYLPFGRGASLLRGAAATGTGQGLITTGQKLLEGESVGESTKAGLGQGLLSAAIDMPLRLVSKIKPAAAKVASLEGSGKNEPTVEYVKNNPILARNTKKKWADIYGDIYSHYKTKKKEVGKLVGTLKEEAAKLGHNVKQSVDPVFDKIDEIALDIPQSSVSGQRISKKITKTIADNYTDGSVENWQKILKEVDGINAMEKLQSKGRDAIKTGYSDTERLLLKMRSTVRDAQDEAISNIPDEGAGNALLAAKKEYAKLSQADKDIFGGITQKNVFRKLVSSFETGKEAQFEALKDFLPKKQFDALVAKVINMSNEEFSSLLGQGATPRGLQHLTGKLVGKAIPKGASYIHGAAETAERTIAKPADYIRRIMQAQLNTQLNK